MRQIRLTPVTPCGDQRTLFGPPVPTYPHVNVNKGERIRRARYALDLTTKAAAMRLGIDAPAYEALERGEFDCDEALACSMLGRHA